MLFAGSSHPLLAEEVARGLGISLGNRMAQTFPDGEIFVEILESVRGKDLFVIQSLARRPNHYLMELLIFIDALKRASARSITAVIPYFGYARQDRKERGRVPITAKLVADMIEKAGATRVVTMDLHAEQIQGFFNIPVDNLLARCELSSVLLKLNLNPCVVVSPDAGSIKIARGYAALLGVDFAIVEKRRLSATQVEATAVIGDLEGRDVILTDDMVTTGGTLCAAAAVCKRLGCKRVIALASHGLFALDALKRIEESPIETLFVSNTVQWGEVDPPSSFKVEVVSVAGLFAKAIHGIVSAESISSLFIPAEKCRPAQ